MTRDFLFGMSAGLMLFVLMNLAYPFLLYWTEKPFEKYKAWRYKVYREKIRKQDDASVRLIADLRNKIEEEIAKRE